MNKVFFTADTHFGDGAIIRYEKRPFENAGVMDDELISLWNQTVGGSDEVYVIGDFGTAGREKEILSRLNGTKFLVKGNHDTQTNEYYRAAGFSEVYDRPILYESFWILSHEPVYVNENMPYANIFGHVHASPLFKDYSSQHYCVSVERTGYRPIGFEAVQKKIKESAFL